MRWVNQICTYHTLIEAYNIVRNSSSEEIKRKWTKENDNTYTLRSNSNCDQKIPPKPKAKSLGFSYNGSKLFNKLPPSLKKAETLKLFKSLVKTWIWENIPSF